VPCDRGKPRRQKGESPRLARALCDRIARLDFKAVLAVTSVQADLGFHSYSGPHDGARRFGQATVGFHASFGPPRRAQEVYHDLTGDCQMETHELALAAADKALQQNVTALVDGLFHTDVTDGGPKAALEKFERRLSSYCAIHRAARRVIEGANPDHARTDNGNLGVDVPARLPR
jgi:hypothetical protein